MVGSSTRPAGIAVSKNRLAVSLAHILDDAHKRDGVAGLRVVLVAAQDEGGWHEHVQVEVVQLHAGLRRHLKQTERYIHTTEDDWEC